MTEKISFAWTIVLLLLAIPSLALPAEKAGKKPDPPGKAAPAAKKGEGKAAAPGEEAPEAPRSVSEIEKDMKKARAAKDYLRLAGLAKEALETKQPAAYKAVIAHALQGEDRDLELSTFRLLHAIEDPALTALIYQEAAKSPNFKTRIILLGIAGNAAKKKDPASFEVLEKALRDPSRPVVLTAIRWLRDAGDAEKAVPILIAGLKAIEKTSDRGRAYHDIQAALMGYTGIENLTAADDWRNYWATRASGKAARRSKGITKAVRPPLEFMTTRIDSDRILFIIDLSYSMLIKDPPIVKEVAGKTAPTGKTTALQPGMTKGRKGKTKLTKEEMNALPQERERLYRVKTELLRLIAALPEHIQFTVLSFNHETHFIGDSPRLLPATSENKRKATEWVSAMQANGETWTDKAFEEALEKVRDLDTIYFLSDGAPRRDNKPIPEAQVRTGIRDLNRFVKARIHTFGFVQEGANLRRFLEKVAAENDGKFTGLE